MNLVIPIPGQDPGPDYATNQYNSMLILDGHNHSAGSGVQINPSGLNINADLSIGGNNLTLVKTVNFQALSANLPGTSPNLGCLYVSGKELVYNDEVGNVVPITNNGSVNSGAGSITGLPSGTASATYSSGSGTFIWQSATSTPANMDFGSAVFRNTTANSNGVTVSAPSALASNYGLVWPTVPAQTNVMTLDASGNMGSITYNQVGQNMGATGANAVANSRTRAVSSTVAAGGVAVSSSCGSYPANISTPTNVTNLSVTITTTGRPVRVGLEPQPGTTNNSYIQVGTNATSGNAIAFISFSNNGTIIALQDLGIKSGLSPTTTNSVFYSPASFSLTDTSINGTPGTYTYTIQTYVNVAGNDNILFQDVILVAYEI
jgi:hypothetical protein